MQHDRMYQPSDIEVLQMENELLAYENAFLKSRIAETDPRGRRRPTPGGIPPRSYESLSPLWQRLKQSRMGPAAVRFRHSAIGRRVEALLLSS